MALLRCLIILGLGSLAACQSSSSYAASSSSVPVSSVASSSYAPGVTHTLPPPPDYDDGEFINPDTSKTQAFTVGSTMNVSWTTKYPSINLYLIYGQDYASPTTCTTGTTKTWWEWDVAARPNNNRPFSFRIVNAEGTQEDQLYGGFYTGQFWLSVPESFSSSSTSSESLTQTTLSATSSLSAATDGTRTSQSSSATAAPNGNGNVNDSNNTVAIGAGVGVGVGAAVLIAGAAGWFLYRRRSKKKQQQQQQQQQPGYQGVSQGPSSDYDGSMGTQQWVNNHQQPWPPSEMSQQNSYYSGAPQSKQPPSEMGQPHYYVEAPGSQVEPRELDARQYK